MSGWNHLRQSGQKRILETSEPLWRIMGKNGQAEKKTTGRVVAKELWKEFLRGLFVKFRVQEQKTFAWAHQKAVGNRGLLSVSRERNKK